MDTTNTAQAIATVVALQGEAFARAADGSMRRLSAGDTLMQGETVITSAGGQVELAMSDGQIVTVLAQESFTVGAEVAQATAPTPGEAAVAGATEIDQVIQAIAQGGELDNLLEETAAGISAGVGAENGGNSFVRLIRIVEGVNPLDYQFTYPPEVVTRYIHG